MTVQWFFSMFTIFFPDLSQNVHTMERRLAVPRGERRKQNVLLDAMGVGD